MATRADTPLAELLQRSSVFAVLWFVLVEASPEALLYGIPVVVAAALISTRLVLPSGRRIHWLQLAAMFPHFLRLVFLGGVDVATRALRPQLPIHPGLVVQPLPEPCAPLRIALAYIFTLQSGSLAVRFQTDGLLLHVIDRCKPARWLTPDIRRRLAHALGQEP